MTTHNLSVAHQLDLSRITDADWGKVRLLEISIDPERIGVDHRYAVHANIYVVAKLGQQVRNVAVGRGDNARTIKVHLCLAELSPGLREGRRGAHVLRLERIDLSLCKREACLRTLYCGLLLRQL